MTRTPSAVIGDSALRGGRPPGWRAFGSAEPVEHGSARRRVCRCECRLRGDALRGSDRGNAGRPGWQSLTPFEQARHTSPRIECAPCGSDGEGERVSLSGSVLRGLGQSLRTEQDVDSGSSLVREGRGAGSLRSVGLVRPDCGCRRCHPIRRSLLVPAYGPFASWAGETLPRRTARNVCTNLPVIRLLIGPRCYQDSDHRMESCFGIHQALIQVPQPLDGLRKSRLGLCVDDGMKSRPLRVNISGAHGALR